jgi:esterase/lipase superfamily enzyme
LARESNYLVSSAFAALQSGDLTIFGRSLQATLQRDGSPYRDWISRVGELKSVDVTQEQTLPNGIFLTAITGHPHDELHWKVGYSVQTQKIEILEVRRLSSMEAEARRVAELARLKEEAHQAAMQSLRMEVSRRAAERDRLKEEARRVAERARLAIEPAERFSLKEEARLAAEAARLEEEALVAAERALYAALAAEPMYRQGDTRRAAELKARLCRQYPALCAPKDSRSVEFLFATTRKKMSDEPTRFSGERAELVYGAARVRVPEGHHVGLIELPGYTLWSLVGYENKADENKHFVIRSAVLLSEDDWKDYLRGQETNEALVFVHGYHTTFEDALYRNAQIIFDLQYKRGISVLFSWPSNGALLDYVYDTNSALNARASFLQVLRTLRSAGVKKIHVLAHSMGNLVVLEALAAQARTTDPLKVAQLIMAAPDVDYDAFNQLAPQVRQISQGMTLYASSADKAMDASRMLAKVPRAGDVTAAGPIVLPDIDTIDVTPVGHELFGLNHDTFAAGRSVLDDVSRLVLDGLRPPDKRLPVEIQPMPEGASPPKFWRFRE